MIGKLLTEQADVDVPGSLPSEIDPSDPDRPRALLGAMTQGFSDGSPAFFLKTCPGTKMDGDDDGVPCERQWCTSLR